MRTNDWMGYEPDNADGSAANADAAGAAAGGASGDGASKDAGGADGGSAQGADAGSDAAKGGDAKGTQDGSKTGDGGEADGGKADGDDAGKTDEDTGAPETYAAFTIPEGMPEGMELDGEALNAFQAAAKADNLSQAKAQRYVDMAAGLVNKTLLGFQQAGEERVSQWAEQLKTDPVVGGREYAANTQIALNAVAEFGDADLKKVFTEYGLGNNPAVVRAFYRIGKAMGESGFVHGQGNEQPAKSSNPEQRLADRIAAEQERAKQK